MMSKLLSPFYSGGRFDKTLYALYLLINGIVLINSILHDPFVGYDIRDHLNIIRVLSEEHHWPTAAQSLEFYSPPIPYLLPTLFKNLMAANLVEAAKFGQLINVLLSAGITYILLKVSDLVLEESRYLKIASLVFLGMTSVYFRTFALIRGETYLTFFAVLAAYQTLHIFLHKNYGLIRTILFGLELSVIVLSRQWGLLLFPAVLLFVLLVTFTDRSNCKDNLRTVGLSYMMAMILGGWFFLFLSIQYGSALAFSAEPVEFSFSTQPAEFYFGTGSGKLFTDPIRPSFSNRLLPTFYSDIWGDYHGYFLVYGRDARSGAYLFGEDLLKLTPQSEPSSQVETNRFSIDRYLGRINAVDLIPSAFLACGWLFGLIRVWHVWRRKKMDRLDALAILSSLIVTCSLGGFAWYLIRYPDVQGSSIKATYMMQVFPFLALGAGTILEKSRVKNRQSWNLILIVLAIIALYNLPTKITHFPLFPHDRFWEFLQSFSF